MNENTLTKMKQMTLHGMHNAFKTAIESGKTDHYTLDQLVSMLIDAEWDERHNRRIERSIKNAKFHYQSSIETLNFDTSRNLDRNLVLRLSECEFVEKNENILITKNTILVTPPDLPHVGFHHHPPETHLLPSVPKTLWPEKTRRGRAHNAAPPAKRLKTHYRPSAG